MPRRPSSACPKAGSGGTPTGRSPRTPAPSPFGYAQGITPGTGVGSAFLEDGRVVARGPGVPPDGRMDLTGADGSPLEETASRRAVLARFGDPSADAGDIADLARAGQRRTRRVLDDAFVTLDAALGPRLTAFGATALVVGGSMAGSRDLVAPELHAGLADGGWTPDATGSDDEPRRPRRHTRAVHPAGLAGDAALIGAARAVAVRD
ncbi:hypothetical protein ACFC18_47240 [Streptomyces sp. NPDC056121]|uniref:hypothetical protein n=1 Tax=Streptomyces sp. NPDC056121 TaxID=3345718 RepID=UPI0035D61CDE